MRLELVAAREIITRFFSGAAPPATKGVVTVDDVDVAAERGQVVQLRLAPFPLAEERDEGRRLPVVNLPGLRRRRLWRSSSALRESVGVRDRLGWPSLTR